MAWSEKLPSGRYRGLYRDAGGKKRSVGRTFTHKAEAVREAAGLEADVRKSMRADPEAYKRPWGEWARDEWWPSRSVEESTRKADAIRLRLHLMPRWEHIPIGSIRRQDVKAWIAAMERQKIKAETRRRIVHLFSASLVAAADAEIIDVNPAYKMKMAGGAKAQERFLTREEFAKVRAEMPSTHDQLIIDFAVNTGLRPSELAGLHWNRVDLDRGLIRVVETFDEIGGSIKAYPKGKQVRDVPLTPELVEDLRALREERGAVRDCGVPHKAGRCRSGLVFTTPTGRPLRNSNWSPKWRDAVDRSGIGHARYYDLRHSYASWLLQAGVPLAEVGRLMGHVSTQTTAIYAHLAEMPRAAVLAALAGPAAPSLPHDEAEAV